MKIKQFLTTAVSVSVMVSGLIVSNGSLISSLLGNLTPTVSACGFSSDPNVCAENTANVSSATTDPASSNNNATVMDVLCQSNDVSTTTTDAKISINPLSNNSYSVVITNGGPTKLAKANFTFSYNDTQIVDPTSVTTTSGTLDTESYTGSGATRVYSNSLSGLSLASGATVTLTINTSVVGSATGTISVNFNATPIDTRSDSYLSVCPAVDSNTANNLSSDTNTVIEAQADLSLVKTSSGGSSSVTNAQGQFIKGNTGSYTLTATNNGPSIAGQPITIVDTMPSALTYVNSVGTNWTCTPSGTTTIVVTCTNPNSLVNGASSAVTLNVTVNA